jgi:hypothetical protein
MCLYFYIFVTLESKLRALLLAWQALFHLSYTSSSFIFSYFLDRALCFCLGLGLDHDPPIYIFCIVGMTVYTLLQFIFSDESHTYFFTRLASNHDPTNFNLLSIWDYRRESLSLALCLYF